MRVALVVSEASLPRWVAHLRARLLQTPQTGIADVQLIVDKSSRGGNRGPALEALLTLERTLTGRSGGQSGGQVGGRAQFRTRLTDDITGTDIAATIPRLPAGIPVNLAVDLRARFDTAAPADAARVLTPALDGQPIETGLWRALLEQRSPVISLRDSATANVAMACAFPAIETRRFLLAGADAVLSHLVAAVAGAVARIAHGGAPSAMAASPHPIVARRDGPTGGSASFAASCIAAAARRRLDRMLKRAPLWQVAWRTANGPTRPPARLEAADYRRLADDGQRYFADPFLFAHDGAMHLFVEELPFSTGKGIISHAVFGRDGSPRAPTPVIEEPYHLSYPQVFAHGGQIWMLPEAMNSGRLTLYRADPFPRRWIAHATLIDEPLSDATLFEHAGAFWIAASNIVGDGSTWDTLSLWSASRLEGPWLPHAGNPVLVDQRSARSGGNVIVAAGELWRPAQDCSRGYGSALSMCRVTSLSTEHFAQEIVATHHYGSPEDAKGPHTLNFAGGIEVIDIFDARPSSDGQSI